MTQEEKVELWEKVMGHRVDSGDIDDLFAKGSECARLWSQIDACEMRILEQLDVDECRELEEMFFYYEKICKIVSLRMFDYGAEFGNG